MNFIVYLFVLAVVNSHPVDYEVLIDSLRPLSADPNYTTSFLMQNLPSFFDNLSVSNDTSSAKVSSEGSPTASVKAQTVFVQVLPTIVSNNTSSNGTGNSSNTDTSQSTPALPSPYGSNEPGSTTGPGDGRNSGTCTEGNTANCPVKYHRNGCIRMQFDNMIGHIPFACPLGFERNGLLCYPLCSNDTIGMGPLCSNGLKVYGRGVGIPMVCPKNTTNYVGLCYDNCPEGFYRSMFSCKQKCPKKYPYKCDRICYKEQRLCDIAKYTTLGRILGIFGLIAGGIASVFTGTNTAAAGQFLSASASSSALAIAGIRKFSTHFQCDIET